MPGAHCTVEPNATSMGAPELGSSVTADNDFTPRHDSGTATARSNAFTTSPVVPPCAADAPKPHGRKRRSPYSDSSQHAHRLTQSTQGSIHRERLAVASYQNSKPTAQSILPHTASCEPRRNSCPDACTVKQPNGSNDGHANDTTAQWLIRASALHVHDASAPNAYDASALVGNVHDATAPNAADAISAMAMSVTSAIRNASGRFLDDDSTAKRPPASDDTWSGCVFSTAHGTTRVWANVWVPKRGLALIDVQSTYG